jgi:hypothetical protein
LVAQTLVVAHVQSVYRGIGVLVAQIDGIEQVEDFHRRNGRSVPAPHATPTNDSAMNPVA